MVFRRRKRYVRRKKRTFKRRRPMRRRRHYARPASAIAPPSRMVAFRYAETVSINSPGGAFPAVYTLRANSLFDPNRTGIGHQPFGFDQAMIFYDHFTVVGSKITVKFIPTTVPPAQTIAIGIRLVDSATNMITYAQIQETKQNSVDLLLNHGSDNKFVTASMTFSAKKFFGKSPTSMIGDGQYKGSASTNPLEGAYFQVWTAPIIATDNPPIIDCQITIDYTAVLTERKPISQS